MNYKELYKFNYVSKTNINKMNDIDSKLNKLLYKKTFIKDLLAQFYEKTVFRKNYDVNGDYSYQQFLNKNNN